MKCTFNEMLEIKNEEIRFLQSELASLKESPEEYFVQWRSAGEWSHEYGTYNNIEDAEERASYVNENTGYETRVISEQIIVHWSSDL